MSVTSTLLFFVLPALMGTIYVWITRERWKQSENPADQRVPLLMGLVLLTSLITLTISLI